MTALVVGTDTYITISEADTYFEHSINGEDWASLGDGDKIRALASATRMFQRTKWQGDPTDVPPTQPLAFPRTGLVDREGNAIADDVVPQDIKDGEAELALALNLDPTVQDELSSGSNIKRVKADVVEVAFFKQVPGGRYPTVVQEYIQPYTDGSSDVTGSESFGTDRETAIEDDQFGLTRGFS